MKYSLAFAMSLLLGCGSQESAPEASSVRLMKSAPSPERMPSEADAAGSVEQALVANAGMFNPVALAAQNLPAARIIIKNASLGFEVASYDVALAQIQKIVEQSRGFVTNSSAYIRDDNVKSGNVTIRVPAEQFEVALTELKKIAKKVENENLSGNDITEEFYDLTARLENKKKAETRYIEILKSAKTVKDILEVEQALTNVREEIERLEGRKRYLSDQAAMSTITINLHETYPLMAQGSNSFVAQIKRGFESGLQGFGEVTSACITFVIAGFPLFVLGFVVIWLLRKLLRRSKKRQTAMATPTAEKSS
ncbi:DUF4349 domain-containing protein [candidate division KSB1 bacterium]|nr:DUF4349 domain-containing protein [candidate division KSB1 bacterium]